MTNGETKVKTPGDESSTEDVRGDVSDRTLAYGDGTAKQGFFNEPAPVDTVNGAGSSTLKASPSASTDTTSIQGMAVTDNVSDSSELFT